MPLSVGSRIGSYEISGPLGAGGMGEVYRAHDTTLRREVAVKVVNPQLCSHPDSRARLRREARALAALNHPHVAAVHEFGESDSGCYIVMEYVPGETLNAILARERLTVSQALRLSGQVAAALEAAHEKGLVHRDLKPGNIRVTPDGVAKVLDFGLARQSDSEDFHQAATLSFATETGAVVGTAAYMSPEQARGRTVDRRTDIWAFGCVLFELLTNRLAFAGDSTSDRIVAILEREPDWSLLPAETPPTIRRLLRRCLEKDASRRLRDIGDARLEIEEALTPAAAEHAVITPSSGSRRLQPLTTIAKVAIGAIAGAVLVLTLVRAPAVPVGPRARFVVPLTGGARFVGTDFPALAISADGKLVAYVASRGDRTQLFVRPLDAHDSTPVAGSADAVSPFFSPDSQWIAFFADGKLKKVPVTGGAPVIVCDAAIGFGGSWGSDDTIVFAPAPGSPLLRVSADGGTPARLTRLDAERGEFSHRWPEILPGGKSVLFTVGTEGSWDDAEVVVQSLDGQRPKVLVKGGTHPHYISTGHLVYTHGGAAWAVPFDAARLVVGGPPIRVLDDVLASFDGAAHISISRNGTVVYIAGSAQQPLRRLIAVDQAGDVAPLAAPARAYVGPRVSPDGRKVLLTIVGTAEEVWVYDIGAGTLAQLTSESLNRAPIWMPDAQRVTFSSNRGGALNLFIASADGSGTSERLTTSDNIQLPGSWAPDGSVLAFVEHHPATGRDIWTLRYQGDRQANPFLVTPFDETAPAFSPDGRWIAYVSNQTGRSEVYVRSFASPALVSQVSTDGGSEPVWGRDGRELFYRTGNRLLALPVSSGATIRTASPRVVFEGAFESGTADQANFDVGFGARRLVMLAGSDQPAAPGEFQILLNWAVSHATR